MESCDITVFQLMPVTQSSISANASGISSCNNHTFVVDVVLNTFVVIWFCYDHHCHHHNGGVVFGKVSNSISILI